MTEMIEMLEERRMFSVSMGTAGASSLPAVQNVVMDGKSAGKVSVNEFQVMKTVDVASTK